MFSKVYVLFGLPDKILAGTIKEVLFLTGRSQSRSR